VARADAAALQRLGFFGLLSHQSVRVFPARPAWWSLAPLRRAWEALRWAAGFVALDNDDLFGLEEGQFRTRELDNVTALDVGAFAAFSAPLRGRHAAFWFLEEDATWEAHGAICAFLDRHDNGAGGGGGGGGGGVHAAADLLAVRIADSFAQNPAWSWWHLAERAGFERGEWRSTLNVVSRISARLLDAVAATRSSFGRFVFYELLWPVTAARKNFTVALLEGDLLVRCCDDVSRDELRAAGIESGAGVAHPYKRARGMCEEGGGAGA